MTFADELRSIHGQAEPEPKPALDYYMRSKVIPSLVSAIENGCRARSREGARSESGYLHYWSGPDYDEGYEYVRELPTVEQRVREANAFNAARYSDAKGLQGTRVVERSLYWDVITTFGDAGRARLVAEGLHEALSDKGFAQLRVSIVKLENIILVERHKNGLTGRLSMSVKSKTSADPLYAVRFEVGW